MQSIKNLIQGLKLEDRSKEFDAFKILDDNIKALENRIVGLEKKNLKYYCRAYSNIAVEVPTATNFAVPLNSTEYPQFGNIHDNTIDNAKIWIRRDGVYHLSAGVRWEAIAGGTFRIIDIVVTGTRGALLVCRNAVPNPVAVFVAQNAATSYYCYSGDYVELRVSHDVGVPLDVVAIYPFSPFLSVSERMEDLDPDQYGLLDPNANVR